MTFKLIVAIVPSGHCDAISQAAKAAGAQGGTILPGRGTAPNNILSLLGFGDSSKEILLSVVPAQAEEKIRQAILDECQKKKGRAGVLFSIKVNSFIKSGNGDDLCKGENIMQESAYQMITAIINKGYAEDAMAAARNAGAGGGTVLGGRGTAREGDAKFFGVEIVPEKETLMILTPREKAAQIVDAIKGLECFSKGGSGIIFTTDASGFSLLGQKASQAQNPARA